MKRLLSGSLLLSALILASCSKECKETTAEYRSQRMVDDVFEFGKPLAMFNFRQVITDWEGKDCDSKTGEIYLRIVNLTDKTVSFGYEVEYFDFNTWTKEGFVTKLAPNDTLDAGKIRNSTQNIDSDDLRVMVKGQPVYE